MYNSVSEKLCKLTVNLNSIENGSQSNNFNCTMPVPGLLTIPAEVREIILRILLVSPKALIINRGRKCRQSAQVLRTCRLLHQEGSRLPYENTFFLSTDHGQLNATSRISVLALGKIRKLQINGYPKPLCLAGLTSLESLDLDIQYLRAENEETSGLLDTHSLLYKISSHVWSCGGLQAVIHGLPENVRIRFVVYPPKKCLYFDLFDKDQTLHVVSPFWRC